MLFILIAIFACDNNIVEQLLGIPLFLAIAMSLIRTLLTSFLGRTHKNVWFRSPDRLTTLSEKSPDFEVEWLAFSLLGPPFSILTGTCQKCIYYYLLSVCLFLDK